MRKRRIVIMFFLMGLVVGGMLTATHMVWKAMLSAAYIHGVDLPELRTLVRFRVDSSFTQVERTLILEAAKDIERASGGCVQPSVVFEPISFQEAFSWREDGRATIYRAANWREWAYHLAKRLSAPDNCVGIAFTRTGDIFIMVSCEPGEIDFRNTVTHEMIHVIFRNGWHSSDRNSLMYYSIWGNKQKLLSVEADKLRALCPKVDNAVSH